MQKGVDAGVSGPFRAYFHQALVAFPYRQSVSAQYHLLKISREEDKVWTSFAPYILAIHCLNEKGENIAEDPVQFAINDDTCRKYQGDQRDFAQDVAAAMKDQAAKYPNCDIRAAFYVPINGLLINILDQREGVTQLTVAKDELQKSEKIDAHKVVFEDFYDKGRDFYASWIDAVQEFEDKRIDTKKKDKLWSFFHNAETEKGFLAYTRNYLRGSMGFLTAA